MEAWSTCNFQLSCSKLDSYPCDNELNTMIGGHRHDDTP